MNVKTFIYDVRGYVKNLAVMIDTNYSSWHSDTAPTSVEAVTSSISDDTLVVTVRYTA